jgi:hypothetical protein
MLTYEVLARCARAKLDEANTHQLAQQLSQFTEWEGISARAEAQGLGPLLYVHLRAAKAALPPTVKRELQGLYLRHRQANRVRTRVLAEVLGACSAAGIQALVLKGAALSHLVYPEPGLRPMSDVDLLVRESDAPAAQSLLASLGFSAPLLEDGEALPPKSQAKAVLVAEGLPVGVEIHHNLCEGFDRLSMTKDDLTAAPLPFSLGSTTAYTLGYEDMLWHLCHHMIIHGIAKPMRLIWVADIVGFADRFLEQIDWEHIRHHYPMVLNTLSLLQSVMPLREALLDRASIKTGRQAQSVAADFEPRPQVLPTRWRRKGYWPVLHHTLFPSELWLRMYYVLDATRWLFWYRWVRHPLEMLCLFGPRLRKRIWRRISERLVTSLSEKRN